MYQNSIEKIYMLLSALPSNALGSDLLGSRCIEIRLPQTFTRRRIGHSLNEQLKHIFEKPCLYAPNTFEGRADSTNKLYKFFIEIT